VLLVRRRLRWKRITTRGRKVRIADAGFRGWRTVRLRAWKSLTCAKTSADAQDQPDFRRRLHAGIQECLANGTQALVLINRRGYSWSVLCRSCGASVQCVNCSISMTHHKQRNRLDVITADRSRQFLSFVRSASRSTFIFFGEGSEHLKNGCEKNFPEREFARLDRDNGAHEECSIRDARRVRKGGHWNISRWHANAGEGTRFSARHAGRCGQRGFVAEHAGFFARRSGRFNC